MALARLAVTLLALVEGISEISAQTLITMCSRRIVYAFETFACSPVAVADCIRVHVTVTLAFLAFLGGSKLTGGVTKVTVSTDLTPGSSISCWTICTYDAHVHELYAPTVFWTWADLAVVRGARYGIAVETFCAEFAIAARRIVFTNTKTCGSVTNMRMPVTVARYARGVRTTVGWFVFVPWSALFTIITHISTRASTLLHPIRWR